MQRRSVNWVAVVVVGLAGVAAMSAATAYATRTAASPFELVALDRYEGECPDCVPPNAHVGTFASGAPFCESGTIDDLGPGLREFLRRYTCSDRSGSLTLAEEGNGKWTIVEGSGSYWDLRGAGSYSYELLSEYPPAEVYRTTYRGLVAQMDTVAPSVAFTSASATKLRRPAGSYSIRVALSIRDDVEGSTVAYALKVQEGPDNARDRRRPFLASEEGTSASGSVSTTLRVHPSSKRVRSVDVWLNGSDSSGNDMWVVRSLKLPR
jgi:hypothetical protein